MNGFTKYFDRRKNFIKLRTCALQLTVREWQGESSIRATSLMI